MVAKQIALRVTVTILKGKSGMSEKSEMVELVTAAIDHLVFVNPNIALSSEHIDVRLGGPVGVGLAAIRIAEGQMHAGKFFVLQKHADHARQSQICSEGQLPDAVAVLIGVAIFPKLLLQILARALGVNEAGFLDLQNQRRGLQVSVLAVEMVAGRGVAHKSAIDGRWRGKNLARRKIGPISRADKSAGFYPIETGIKMRGDVGACFGFYSEGFGAHHAFP